VNSRENTYKPSILSEGSASTKRELRTQGRNRPPTENKYGGSLIAGAIGTRRKVIRRTDLLEKKSGGKLSSTPQ